jgi:hypothetical protein
MRPKMSPEVCHLTQIVILSELEEDMRGQSSAVIVRSMCLIERRMFPIFRYQKWICILVFYTMKVYAKEDEFFAISIIITLMFKLQALDSVLQKSAFPSFEWRWFIHIIPECDNAERCQVVHLLSSDYLSAWYTCSSKSSPNQNFLILRCYRW